MVEILIPDMTVYRRLDEAPTGMRLTEKEADEFFGSVREPKPFIVLEVRASGSECNCGGGVMTHAHSCALMNRHHTDILIENSSGRKWWLNGRYFSAEKPEPESDDGA
jgi:hypothetical protein